VRLDAADALVIPRAQIKLTLNFMEMLRVRWSIALGHAEGHGDRRMLQALFMRHALSIVCALLGGFGVFCVIYSFSTPHIAAQALILLSAALAVSYFTSER
jgi:hypothetical protein